MVELAFGFAFSRGATLNAGLAASVSGRPRKTCVPARQRSGPSTHSITSLADSEDLSQPLVPGSWDGSTINVEPLIAAVKFDAEGLVPAVAQQFDTGEVLMVAWMSAESIAESLRGGRAVYYSRSRKTLWRKGDTSGQVQMLCDVLLDCDGDTLVLKVDQKGVACHTGRRSCFYNAYRAPSGERVETHEVLMDPKELYAQS